MNNKIIIIIWSDLFIWELFLNFEIVVLADWILDVNGIMVGKIVVGVLIIEAFVWVSVVILADDVKVDEAVLVFVVEVDDSELQLLVWQHEYE